MKFYKLRFPVRLSEHFAKWTFENSVRVILSYATEEFFSGGEITSFVAVPEEKVEEFTTEFGKYFKS